MNKYVIYLRVSTDKQGKSGLGLDAQKRDISLYLENYSETPYEVLGEFIDIQSGGDNDRPELLKAIQLAKKTKSTLLVQKICRISRRVSFIASLMEDKDFDFKVAQMPNADKFQLHIHSALNEMEKDFISSRTKAALRSWKERNPHKKLGAPSYHLTKLNQGKKDKALKEAKKVSGIILPLKREGLSLRSICHQLNKNGIRTSRGKDFHPSLVSRMISVLEAA
jgi:DNA invertase Pin-like site-specific DNA recombinase|tara:strand:+ start:64 stop:732 length:669 start_codon:yes stop_codon:yes gene_type:complete